MQTEYNFVESTRAKQALKGSSACRMDAVDFLYHESPPIQACKHKRTIPASNQLLHTADGAEDKEFHIFM
ncbi:hypothetical protein TNCV_3946191 [Trichonephila clavipes]|nr:hypothetical protein TNCV_3946191 [Trichonephila clavipes]